MKKISTFILAGLEVVGIILLTQHRYMNFRNEIFITMCLIGAVYFVCETVENVWSKTCDTDIICNRDEEENLALEDLEDIKEIIEEIEDRIK